MFFNATKSLHFSFTKIIIVTMEVVMSKKICCVNDLPGVGKVALGAMIPMLSAKGISVTSLPTALVSNTLDFGKFEILDTSEYMDKCVDVWHELGFRFDCIATGFMVNPKQIEIIEKLIQYQNKEDLLVIVDPIMGDEGKLYNGVTQENVEIMKRLSSKADILIPNFTEACFLTDSHYEGTLNLEDAKELVNKCLDLGCKSVVITSACVQNRHCVVGYDHLNDDLFFIDFNLIDVQFPGTGDVFSAVLISDVLNGANLHDATYHAMNVVSSLIMDNLDKKDRFEGVDIEKFISEAKV